MQEQRPIGNNVMIVDSHASCVPFSFIFNAPYNGKCEDLYTIDKTQEEDIQQFILGIY
jgi:hypothetical protein